MSRITIKFGGSALQDAEAFERAAQYVLNQAKSHTVVVVVSATKGTTDSLLAITQQAKQNLAEANQRLVEIFHQHQRLAASLLPQTLANEWNKDIFSFFQEAQRRVSQIHHQTSNDGAIAYVLALGEKLSASILSHLILNKGIAALWVRSELLIKTTAAPLEAEWNELTTQTAFEKLPVDYFESAIRVVTGFCGSDIEGNTTLLGRNASDFSAAIITAYATDQLVIIGDTGGILSADPDYVPGAINIPELSIEDAALLSQCGAGVLHPRTLAPLLKKHKLASFSSLECHSSSTKISANQRIRTKSFIAAWVPPERQTLSKKPPLPLFLKKWHAQTPDAAVVSVFLADDLAPKVWQQKLCAHAEKAGVSVLQRKFIVQNRLLVFAIDKNDLQRFTRLAHSALHPLHQETAIAIIGASGRIGKQTLRLLLNEGRNLSQENGLHLRVVAICNSSQVLWCKRHENDLDALIERLSLQEKQVRAGESLVKELLSQCYDKLIVVDASASKEIASLYERFLEAGVAIVTPNKIANSDALARYHSLQNLARNRLAPYLFETTVAAALPVLKPLLDLRRAGDVPTRVQAVLSGTIGYILDRIQQGVAFSVATQEAVEKGYAEPDPLQDLSGEDVARKILILLRTCGVTIEREQIAITPLQIGNADGSLPQDIDLIWQQKVEEARALGKRLCYCAHYNEKNVEIGLRLIDPESAFFRLRSTENAVIYQSLLYPDIPLTITGPGAGVPITSAGVYADIIAASEALARRAHLSLIAA